MRIGCCTPSSRAPTSLPAPRTSASWSRPGRANPHCPGPSGWHVSKNKPDIRGARMMGERSSYSQPLEENKEKRIGQVLRRIVLAFSYSPPPKANRETRSEQGFSYSQWLEKNRAKFPHLHSVRKEAGGTVHGLLCDRTDQVLVGVGSDCDARVPNSSYDRSSGHLGRGPPGEGGRTYFASGGTS